MSSWLDTVFLWARSGRVLQRTRGFYTMGTVISHSPLMVLPRIDRSNRPRCPSVVTMRSLISHSSAYTPGTSAATTQSTSDHPRDRSRTFHSTASAPTYTPSRPAPAQMQQTHRHRALLKARALHSSCPGPRVHQERAVVDVSLQLLERSLVVQPRFDHRRRTAGCGQGRTCDERNVMSRPVPGLIVVLHGREPI